MVEIDGPGDKAESTVPYKLLIVLDTVNIGGPGKGVLQFCNAVGDRVQITIANGCYPSFGTQEFNTAVEAANIPFLPLVQKSKFDVRPLNLLRRTITDQGIDLLQSHSFKAHVYALILSRQIGLPWVAFAHGWTAQDRRVRVYNWLEKKLLRYADELCVVSTMLGDELSKSRRRGRVHVIPNAIEIGREARQATADSAGDRAFRMICVGRLSHEKGQDILLRALAEIDASIEWGLDIVGVGPESERLRALSNELGLQRQVVFYGYKTDVAALYAESDLLVVPSRSEGIPNVVLEAMANRLPVLATSVGGIPEVIEDGVNGFTTEADVAAMATSIRSLLGNRPLLADTAARALEALHPKFDPVVRAERIVGIHQALLARSPA